MKKLLLILLCLPMIGFGQCISGDCENGYGTFTWGKGEWEGDKYVGEWKDNKRHGIGTYTFANGDKYVEEFNNNQKTGEGTCTYANGDKYVGEWKDGKSHGKGTFTLSDGGILEGLFENGEFIE